MQLEAAVLLAGQSLAVLSLGLPTPSVRRVSQDRSNTSTAYFHVAKYLQRMDIDIYRPRAG